MHSPDYTRLAGYLPAVYQDDAASFAQLDGYLGLVDELNHAYLERLEDLALTLGPDAALRWPADLPLDAGGDAVIDAYLAAYDAAAEWAAFTFPSSWERTEHGVARRRELLARMARLWRRRGTPRGFLDWFCLFFEVTLDNQPYLLEHFKVPGPQIPRPELTGTLFVPCREQFADFRNRREAVDFVQWYSPAHVLLQVCWAPPDFRVPEPPARPATGADPPAAERYRRQVDAYRADLRAILCTINPIVAHAEAIRVWDHSEPSLGNATYDSGRDQLGVGHLPTDLPTE